MEISNFSIRKLLRYFSNPIVISLYCSSSFLRTLKPSSNPLSTISSAICDFDLNLQKNKRSLCILSSEMPSKCNLDLNPSLKMLSFYSSNCSFDSYPLHKKSSFFCSSYSILPVSISPCSTSSVVVSRCFSVSARSREYRGKINENSYIGIDEVIEIIRSDEGDLQSKLRSVAPALDSKRVLKDTFKALNWLKISGLKFFRVLLEMNPNLHRSGDVCSLVINNCGWLGDYDAMLSLLEEFKMEKICLNQMAFEFLPVFDPNKSLLMESTRRVVDLLNKVGGSCCNSGVTALIEKFCRVNSFKMAKFVIEMTDRSVSRNNILIRALCRRGRIEEAHAILEEMIEKGYLIDATSYNYLLSYLCKNNRMNEACNLLNEMKERGVHPNAITFEALIFHSSIRGQLDVASQFLDWMVLWDIEPRHTTVSAFLKALFVANQQEKAYKYVNDLSAKFSTSSNNLFNLLAELHLKNGDPVTSKNIVTEMMEKGLIPNSSIYLQCETTYKE